MTAPDPGAVTAKCAGSLRVLVVNQYFPPDTSATAAVASDLVAVLAQRGHQVSVVVGRPSYHPAAPRNSWRLLDEEADGSATVLRVGSSGFRREWAPGRLINYASYAAMALSVGVAQRFDVVIAMTDPPFAGLIGALVAWARRRPFVYYVQDYHPDAAVALGAMSDGPLIRRWAGLHRRTLRSASRVVVLGRDMAEHAIGGGARAPAVRVVRSGATLGPDPDPDAARHREALRIRGGAPFLAVHAGNLGHAGAWDTLIDAAAMVEQNGVSVVFVGRGTERGRLEGRTAQVANVRIVDFLPAELTPCVLAAPDIHIVTVRRGLEGLVIPSKFYGVLAAGRPVLVVADERSEVAMLVRDHGCGLVADPDDPSDVAQCLRWSRRHPAELAEMGRRARQTARAYDRGAMMGEVVSIAEEAAGYRASADHSTPEGMIAT